MRITRVNVKKTKRAGAIVGVASIVLDEAICVNNIEIIDGKHELYISFPFKSKTNVAHPTEEEFRRKIQEAIIEEYKNIEG